MLISKAEFARRMNVTTPAVHKACKCGRLSVINGKWLDEKVAALQWEQNRRRAPNVVDRPAQPEPLARSPTEEVQSLQTPGFPTLEASRRKREHHEANLAEMRERQKAGELVELAEVEKTTATIFAQMCNALEGIGDKIGDRIAAESDPFACRTLINDEIAQIRADLAAALTAQADRLQEAESS